MKKLILVLMLGIVLISLTGFASAETETLGTFKVGQEINLIQICASCSYNNITSIISPNSSEVIGNFQMTQTGSVYNFTLTRGNVTFVGEYIVNGIGDLNGVDEVWSYNFFTTPTGFANNFGFYAIILVISGVLIVWGFSIKDPWIIFFGTFGLYFTGLYVLLNGIVGIKDTVTTWAIALILLGVAAYLSIRAGQEVMNG